MSRTLATCSACGAGLAWVRAGGTYAVLPGVAVAAKPGCPPGGEAAFAVCPGCRRLERIAGVRVVLLPTRAGRQALRSRGTLVANGT